MARRSRSRKQLGYSIADRWKERRREVGKQWQARVWDSTQSRYHRKSFEDRGDAIKWAEHRQAELLLGTSIKTRCTSLKEVGDDYLSDLKDRKRSDRHIQQVKQILDDFIAAGMTSLVDDDLPCKVRRYLSTLKKRRGAGEASDTTKNKFLGVMKAVSRYANEWRMTPYDLMLPVKPFSTKKAIKECYTMDELRLLLSEMMASHELYCYVAFLIYTGVRGSEAKCVLWKMIDWSSRTLLIPASAEGNKLKRDYRLPLQTELVNILRPRASVGCCHLLPDKYVTAKRNDYLMRAMKRYFKLAGVAPKSMYRHAFRNTCASLLTAIDVPFYEVLTLLNHQDVKVSQEYASGSLIYRSDVESWTKDKEFYILRSIQNCCDNDNEVIKVKEAK